MFGFQLSLFYCQLSLSQIRVVFAFQLAEIYTDHLPPRVVLDSKRDRETVCCFHRASYTVAQKRWHSSGAAAADNDQHRVELRPWQR